MGLWFRGFELQADERVVYKFPANRTVRNTTKGGRLGLTDRGLIFEPHRLDAAFGASPCRIPLEDIKGVSVEAATVTTLPFGGGFRKRLRIDLRDGGTELFVVSNPSARVQNIAAAIGG